MKTIVAVFVGIVGLSLLPVIRFYIFRLRLRLKIKLLNATKGVQHTRCPISRYSAAAEGKADEASSQSHFSV